MSIFLGFVTSHVSYSFGAASAVVLFSEELRSGKSNVSDDNEGYPSG